LTPEFEELRISMERLRALLDGLAVRGLRACGEEQMVQLEAFVEQLEQAGAGHVGALLEELRGKIEKDDRGAAKALLTAQNAVRLLERLLTLRVVGGMYAMALARQDGAGDDQTADEGEA
jgi:hypothetical protein